MRALLSATFVALAISACGGGSAPQHPTGPVVAPDGIHITIGNNGDAIYDKTPVSSIDELVGRAKDAAKPNPEQLFVVDAEADVSFARLMAAITKMRAHGIRNIAFGGVVASMPGSGAKVQTPEQHGGRANEPHASVPSDTKFDCVFPPPGERANLTEAQVLVKVTVEPDGKPSTVEVVKEPGGGFAAAAKRCAMGKTYTAAKNAAGQPVQAQTFPFYLQFSLK